MGTIGFVQLCFGTKCGRFLTIRKIYGDQPDVGHFF